jgi:acetyl-CoA carboxylase carboxyltransferase component
MRQALALASCPRLLVITGRADGLAFASAAHSGWATDGAYAWPGATSGAAAPDEDAVPSRRIEEATGVYGLDELIAPSATRDVLVADLTRLAHRRVPSPDARPLAGWSTC